MQREDLLSFLLETEALVFGRYKTKSGRESPYYLNTGVFSKISWLEKIGSLYCQQIEKMSWDATYVFGSAYKGIGLAVGTGFAMVSKNKSIRVGFDRKEKKDHGDTGIFVGPPVTVLDKVVIVDDVLTTGTSLLEAKKILEEVGATVLGSVVLLDRMEKSGPNNLLAKSFLQRKGLEVTSILSIEEVFASKIISSYLQAKFDNNFCKKIDEYREKFGYLDRR